jgi:hypothetical protein
MVQQQDMAILTDGNANVGAWGVQNLRIPSASTLALPCAFLTSCMMIALSIRLNKCHHDSVRNWTW